VVVLGGRKKRGKKGRPIDEKGGSNGLLGEIGRQKSVNKRERRKEKIRSKKPPKGPLELSRANTTIGMGIGEGEH